MSEVEGVVDEVSPLTTSTGKPMYKLKIGNDTYSNFGDAPTNLTKGCIIKLEYDQSGVYKNIKEILSIEKPKETNNTPKKHNGIVNAMEYNTKKVNHAVMLMEEIKQEYMLARGVDNMKDLDEQDRMDIRTLYIDCRK